MEQLLKKLLWQCLKEPVDKILVETVEGTPGEVPSGMPKRITEALLGETL